MKKLLIIAGIAFSTLMFMSGEASAETQSADKDKTVTIKRGDTLDKIAKKNDTTYVRLFDANKKIKHPDVIYAGEKIRVPDADEKLARRTLAVQKKAVDKPVRAASYSASAKTSNYAASSTARSTVSGGVWDRLAACESGGNWSINTGNGYYGGLQFTLATWRGVGGSGYPHQASKAEQINRGKILQAQSGWGQWPACAAKLGLI